MLSDSPSTLYEKKSCVSIYCLFLSWVFSVSSGPVSPIVFGSVEGHIPYNHWSVWRHWIKFIVQVFMVCTVIPNPPVSSICIRVWTDFQILKSQNPLTIRKRRSFYCLSIFQHWFDLIRQQHCQSLSDIKRKNIVVEKSMTLRFSETKRISVVSSGIVVVDLKRMEIKDTYYIGVNGKSVNVNGLSTDGTIYLPHLDSGIYKAQISDPNIFNTPHGTKTRWCRTEMPIFPQLLLQENFVVNKRANNLGFIVCV